MQLVDKPVTGPKGPRFEPVGFKAEILVETEGRLLLGIDGEQDLFDAFERGSAGDGLLDELVAESLTAEERVHVHSENPAAMVLLVALDTEESDGGDEPLLDGEGSDDKVIGCAGAESMRELFNRLGAMLLGRVAECGGFLNECLKTQIPICLCVVYRQLPDLHSFQSNDPPAKPEALRLMAPQKGKF